MKFAMFRMRNIIRLLIAAQPKSCSDMSVLSSTVFKGRGWTESEVSFGRRVWPGN
jgi:hypothetical protein